MNSWQILKIMHSWGLKNWRKRIKIETNSKKTWSTAQSFIQTHKIDNKRQNSLKCYCLFFKILFLEGWNLYSTPDFYSADLCPVHKHNLWRHWKFCGYIFLGHILFVLSNLTHITLNIKFLLSVYKIEQISRIAK